MSATKIQKMDKSSEEPRPRLLHDDILDAIDQDDNEALDTVLVKYPNNTMFLPSLCNVTVKSYTILRVLSFYYMSMLDINLYNHIFTIGKTIKNVEDMRDFATFMLYHKVDFTKETGYGIDSLSYFYRVVQGEGMLLIIATEALKRNKLLRFTINRNPDEYKSIAYMIECWDPSKEEEPYYLEFVEECLRAGILFKEGSVFKNKEIAKLVKKYPRKVTKEIKYNC